MPTRMSRYRLEAGSTRRIGCVLGSMAIHRGRLLGLHLLDMISYLPRYDRQIIALGYDELEKFVREWALQKKEYKEVELFTGSGDMGRDVVGFLTKQRHEGAWHNYQCKQYGKTLPTALGIREVGK